MNGTCDYAACVNAATERADGWGFCRTHLTEHRALQVEDDGYFATHGTPFPKTLEPCGTAAAARRHLRNGDPACARCLEAAATYRNPDVSRGFPRRSSWRRAS